MNAPRTFGGPVRSTLHRHLGRADLTRHLGSGARLIARFGTIGLLAFVVDVGSFNLLRHALDLGPLSSKTASVTLATTFAFFGNLAWTFDERGHRRVGTAYALFFLLNGVALLISLACLAFSSYVLGLRSPLAENISTNVVGIGLGTLFRFWAYQHWVFPPGSEETPEERLITGPPGPRRSIPPHAGTPGLTRSG